MDTETARFNMIEQQIRPWDVLEPKILNLMARIPREQFVAERYQSLAFTDSDIPLNSATAMLQPKVVGRILQSAKIDDTCKVLQIGAGSGYMTALIASLADQVVALEIDDALYHTASKNLSTYQNVKLINDDVFTHWENYDTFDIIIFSGALHFMPDKFKSYLKPSGKIVAIIGDENIMTAFLIELNESQEWRTTTLFETKTHFLINAPKKDPFQF